MYLYIYIYIYIDTQLELNTSPHISVNSSDTIPHKGVITSVKQHRLAIVFVTNLLSIPMHA